MAKRRAAVAASGCKKLLVRNRASEFSPYWLGSSAVRRANVSGRRPDGSFLCVMGALVSVVWQGQARVVFHALGAAHTAGSQAGDVGGLYVTGDIDTVKTGGIKTGQVLVQ